MDRPKNLPLSASAVLSPRVQWHLCLIQAGEVLVVFPRSTPFAEIDRIKKRFGGEIYKIEVEISYRILQANEYYDHSPRISL